MLKLQTTQICYLLSYILYTPFWGIYNLLPFILHKDLHATAFQIALLITLKPVVSIFSLYWSSHIAKRRDRLKKNIIFAGILGNIPFFLYPWIESVWFFIFTAALFMLLARGVVPAWMEVLKLNLPSASRNKLFGLSSTICYAISGLFPLLYGFLMDEYIEAWRWIFPITACISLIPILLQSKLPIPEEVSIKEPPKEPFLKYIAKPWKESWKLLKEKREYAFYQLGFMITGFGVMLWQPALPIFFIDTLNLSYMELATALAFCKGIGYTVSSPLWAKYFTQESIFRLYAFVSLLFCLFPLLLMLSSAQIAALYFAYILYGITQSASEMSWSLSGPTFARDHEDSSVYSSINILSVGLRGCVAPPIGAYLLGVGGSTSTLVLGSLLCLGGAIQLALFARKKEGIKIPV